MKKKVNINREPISSDEILKRRDFDQLLSQFPGYAKPPLYKSGWFVTTLASVAVVVTAGAFYLANSAEPAEEEIITHSEPKINLDEEIITYDEDTPCVNPPAEELDVPTTSYIIDPTIDNSIEHTTGSKIEIPANSFLNEDGSITQDKVEIKYREFHDPLDFLVSGIPMTYDSAGTTMTFESAGMLEIYAESNGKDVKLAEGKEIQVDFEAKNSSPTFHLYELDQEARNWKYRGEPSVHLTSVDESTGEVQEIDEEAIESTESVVEARTAYEQAQNDLEVKQRAVNDFKKKAPQKPAKPLNKDRQFNLDVDPRDFPELGHYDNLLFEVEADEKNFSSQVYEIEWEDVELSENKSKNNYYMTLFKGNKNLKLEVHPVFRGKDLQIAQAEYDKQFKVYSKKLGERKADEQFAKDLVAKKLEVLKKERELARQRQVENHFKYAQDASNRITTGRRIFGIATLGIWNCDRGVELPKGGKVKATLSHAGKVIIVTALMLIDRLQNSIFKFNPKEQEKLTFNPEAQNVLVGFTKEKDLAVYRGDFQDLKNKSKYTFEMEVIAREDVDIDQLKKEFYY